MKTIRSIRNHPPIDRIIIRDAEPPVFFLGVMGGGIANGLHFDCPPEDFRIGQWFEFRAFHGLISKDRIND